MKKTVKNIFSKRFLLFLKHFILGIIASFVAIFPYKRKNIWLIAERYNEAKDNGYRLFQYICDHHLNEDAYYVIDKKAKDYEKIKKYENVVSFGSYKHHLLYWRASRLISTHIHGYCPSETAYRYLSKIRKCKGKKVFLQHGIIKDNLPQLYRENTDLDLFVCGAKKEFEYVNSSFGYQNEEVKYLGLCRYDHLNNDHLKNQILIMPTFRMQYYIDKDKKLSLEMEKKFLCGSFFRMYHELLQNEKLLTKLKEHHMKIVFFPHYEMQKYLHLFQNLSEIVVIADGTTNDVQTLLNESKLLVTDFSSVFFDFGYLEKPIIYFQFDEKEYRNDHYQEGYFSYQKDGFGAVVDTTEKVVEKIIFYIDHQFEVEDIYKKRKNSFFVYHDQNNCQRNYEAIKKL